MTYSYNPLASLGLDKSIPLDGAGKIPSAYLPSYVDDVVEYDDLASFPATGETGKIYVAKDTGYTYRWTGSVYVRIGSGGEVALNLGSVGSPSLYFTGDTNTGIYSPGADQVAISTNGNGRLFIDSAGKVGLGTSVPGNTLHVNSGNIGLGKYSDQSAATRFIGITGTTGFENVFTAGIGITTTVANESQDVFLQSHNYGVGYNTLILKANGNVGVGTTSPGHNLEIKGSFPDFAISDSDTVNDKFRILHNSGATQIQVDPNNVSANSNLLVAIDGTECARIDSSGRFLVGTSSDSGGALLQVNGDRIRVGTAKTPASATATGTAGEICWDADYVYVCTATNTWKRTAIATW